MLKRTIYIFLIILFISITFKSCLHADIPEAEITEEESVDFSMKSPDYPGPYKTVSMNGVDYRLSRSQVGKYGGSIYTSTIGEGPKTFNPWNAKDATSSEFGELMFDGLTSTDAYTGEVIPQMAKEIDVDDTGTQYTIALRKGLQWSDGEEITADDVVFTWNEIIIAGFGNTSMRDNIMIDGQFPLVTKIDKYTVKFSTPKPFAPFLRQLSASIAPKHVLKPVVEKGKKAFGSFWGVTTPPKKFVTSGKYRLKEYIPAQRVKFVRNKHYYAVDKENNILPYIDNYVVFIVGDLNNEVLKFEAGEIDVLGVKGSNVARFKEFEKRSNYKMYNLGPNTGTTFITFNMKRSKNKDEKYYVDPIKQKWFNDLNFRKAVDYAIDRESMVSNILSGVGATLFTAESLPSIFLNKDLKNGHERNINKAKTLLKEAGFSWNDKKLLVDKDGNIVEFTLYTNAGNTERESTGVMIKQDLEELGMKVNFKPVEFNVLVGKLIDTLDWDMVLIGLTGSSLEPHGGRNVWDSHGAMHMFNMRKPDEPTIDEIRDWEAQIDEIYESGAQELDFEKRKEIYDQYQAIAYEQRPFIYLYSPLRIMAVRNKFGNIKPTPLGGVLHNLEEIYVK